APPPDFESMAKSAQGQKQSQAVQERKMAANQWLTQGDSENKSAPVNLPGTKEPSAAGQSKQTSAPDWSKDSSSTTLPLAKEQKTTTGNVASDGSGNERSRRQEPPLGAPAPAAGVAISVVANGKNSQVESYDEDTFVCRANESFRSISQACFQTDRYEK